MPYSTPYPRYFTLKGDSLPSPRSISSLFSHKKHLLPCSRSPSREGATEHREVEQQGDDGEKQAGDGTDTAKANQNTSLGPSKRKGIRPRIEKRMVSEMSQILRLKEWM